MAFEEGGSRIDDLKAILARTAEVATLFDSDGILVSIRGCHVCQELPTQAQLTSCRALPLMLS